MALTPGLLGEIVANGNQKLKTIQDLLLGPRNTRNGTAAIEKSSNSSNAGHQGPRCYTIGTSIETGTQRMGPAANICPGISPSADCYWKTLGEVVPMLADLHSEAIASALAPEDTEFLARRGEYYNAPAIGSTRRHLVAGMQVNVTGVSGRSSKSHEALGSAAVFHTDDGDDFCCLSALTNLSDVGPGFHLGFFFLLEYGIAFEWEPFSTILASGRALHVSSPPRLSSQHKDRQPEPWELRLLAISYPSFRVLTRGGPAVLSAAPDGPLIVPPRLSDPNTRNYPITRTWASAGGALMSPENLHIFLAREVMRLGQHIFSQVPGLSGIARINPEKFLGAFEVRSHAETMDGAVHMGEEWVTAIPQEAQLWEHGPWTHCDSLLPNPPPCSSGLISRHQNAFPMLAAKKEGIIPSKSARAQGSKSEGGQAKRAPMSRKQKAIVEVLLAQNISSKKHRLNTSDSGVTPPRRKRKNSNIQPLAIMTKKPENYKEDSSSHSSSDDLDYLPFDGVIGDEDEDTTVSSGPVGSSLVASITETRAHYETLQKGTGSKPVSVPSSKICHQNILEFSHLLLKGAAQRSAFTESATLDNSVTSGIIRFWSEVKTLQSSTSHHWFFDIRLNAGMMLSTWRVWFWVEGLFRQAGAQAMVEHDRTSWIGKLVHDVYHHVLQRRSTTFRRETYLSLPPMDVQLIQPAFISGTKALTETIDVAVKLMHMWMAFPIHSGSESSFSPSFHATIEQSRFVHLLLASTLSADILSLPAIQRAWCALPTEVFGQRKISTLSDGIWIQLQGAMEGAIGEANSAVNALLCAHGDVCAKYPRSKHFTIPALSSEDLDILGAHTSPLDVGLDLSSYWTQYHARVLPELEEGLEQTLSPVVATISSTLATGEKARYLIGAQALKNFLLSFLPLHSTTLPQDSWSETQMAWFTRLTDSPSGLSTGLDLHSPLRELCPSRQLVASESGPFAPNYIRTVAGFFSVLLFRGITFTCAPFLLLPHRNRFSSLEEWNTAIATAKSNGLTEEDICNKQAYGTTQRGRTTACAKAYWSAANKLWPDWLGKYQIERSGSIRWDEGLSLINRRIANRAKLLPEIGPVTAYHIAVDLVYAGVFAAPSLQEYMASPSWPDSGTHRALSRLGLINPRSSPKEIGEQFQGLYYTLTSLLGASEQQALGWDIFTFDHALGKGVYWDIY
ncbi:hypothetical protein FRC11_006348 [Ceratobasidium sp. 423]|nr:hypothetical protein FRC11_006348 [Ceratobasidium sp. 423]